MSKSLPKYCLMAINTAGVHLSDLQTKVRSAADQRPSGQEGPPVLAGLAGKGWLVGRLVGRSVGRLVGWSAADQRPSGQEGPPVLAGLAGKGWLVGADQRPSGQEGPPLLAGLAGKGWLVGRLVGRLVGWLELLVGCFDRYLIVNAQSTTQLCWRFVGWLATCLSV